MDVSMFAPDNAQEELLGAGIGSTFRRTGYK
jgi:hypothetical protein